jgi:hypothetical protein
MAEFLPWQANKADAKSRHRQVFQCKKIMHGAQGLATKCSRAAADFAGDLRASYRPACSRESYTSIGSFGFQTRIKSSA